LLLAEDEQTSIINGALVGVLLSQSASPSVVCLSSPRSTYLGFLTEGKTLLLYSSHLPLGVPNGLVIYHASSISYALSRSDGKGYLSQHYQLGSFDCLIVKPQVVQNSDNFQRRVARTLCFDSAEGTSVDHPVVFTASPPPSAAKRKKGKGKKLPTPFVYTGLRRSKRTCVAQASYRPGYSGVGTPLSAAVSSKKVAVNHVDPTDDVNDKGLGADTNDEIIPKTPIFLLQKVVKELEIDPEKITKEKFKAAPKTRKSKKCPNDK
jgi:hypothetical protein